MIRYGINLIRNIHYELWPHFEVPGEFVLDDNCDKVLDDNGDPIPIEFDGLDPKGIILETSSEIAPPYLLLRRGDDVPTPWDPLLPIGYFFDMEYVISEEGIVVDNYQADQVGTIRALDEQFMKRLRQSPLLRSTSDVQEGLSEDRLAYILSRRVELAADLPVELNKKLECRNGS